MNLFADTVVVDPGTQWVAAATAIAITLGLIAQIVLQVMAREQATAAAKDVAAVKENLQANDERTTRKMGDMAEVAKATHTLVNSNMGTQLKLNSVVSRRLAKLTNDATDIQAANLADELYDAHVAKQNVVDEEAKSKST